MCTIKDIDDKDICINFGCVDEDCRKCDLMCNPQCVNYESNNTRQEILNEEKYNMDRGRKLCY